MRTATYKDLMNLGFPEHTSRDIIREAKRIMLCFFEHLGYNNYRNCSGKGT